MRGLEQFLTRIAKYRRTKNLERDPTIGCSILAEPFFLPEHDWIPIPTDWAPSIVQGKTYDSAQESGAALWTTVQARLPLPKRVGEFHEDSPSYGSDYLARARLGQGAFRILVTDAYDKRCAVTGERTLPVLQASHIKPFASQGPNRVSNGLLLRSDLHILFDRGYLTLSPTLHVEVSKRIREEFENGREYYAYHGRELVVKPDSLSDQPALEFLRWHNEYVFEKNGLNL